MATRLSPVLAGLLVLVAASCNKPAPPQATVVAATLAAPVQNVPAPSCSVESKREIKFDDGSEMQIWNLKATGLKRLTARMIIAAKGKAQTANEIEYDWDTWKPDTPAATGRLVFLVQDGKPFGVKDKRLPMMALDIDGSPSNSKANKKTGALLEGELQPRMVNSSYSSSLNEKNLLYAQLFVSKGNIPGNFTLSSDLDSVIAAAKDGCTILAVTLDWVPQ